jgi:hypothetical protein
MTMHQAYARGPASQCTVTGIPAFVARMSDLSAVASCEGGSDIRVCLASGPACRYAHAGYSP